MDLGALGPALAAFVVVLPAELPDKTFVATLVLATRFRPLAVWIGVSAAFAVQCLIAVTAGGLLALLPRPLVLAGSAALFATGAVLMLRSGLRSRSAERAAEQDEAAETEQALVDEGGRLAARPVVTSFVILFAAEWGDLSQLLTAGLAARYQAPAAVFVGAWAALMTVAAFAVLAGRWLQERVPLARVRLASAGVLAVLAVVTALEAVRAL